MSNGPENKSTLDERISIRGYFERVLNEQEARHTERDRRYEARFKAQEEAVQSALVSAEKAIDKAFLSQQRINEGQNEFRGALKDQQAELAGRAVSRETYESNIKEWSVWRTTMDTAIARLPQPDAIEQRLKMLENSYARSQGAIAQAKTDASTLAVKVSTAIGTGAIAVSILLKFVS